MFRDAAEQAGVPEISSAAHTYQHGRNNSRAIESFVNEKLELEDADFHVSRTEILHLRCYQQ